MTDIRTHYLDASAIVKLLVDEDGSPVLKAYFGQHSVFSTTWLCFAETLGVLKLKFLRKLIDQERYLSACEELMAHLRGQSLEIDDVGISHRSTFDEVEQLAKKHSLDISDAYQLVTLRRGVFSRMTGASRPILITADDALAVAARAEGLRVWHCLRESAPDSVCAAGMPLTAAIPKKKLIT
jgi:predicted nucleic acid-binding protein